MRVSTAHHPEKPTSALADVRTSKRQEERRSPLGPEPVIHSNQHRNGGNVGGGRLWLRWLDGDGDASRKNLTVGKQGDSARVVCRRRILVNVPVQERGSRKHLDEDKHADQQTRDTLSSRRAATRRFFVFVLQTEGN